MDDPKKPPEPAPEKHPTLAELVKAKMDKEYTSKPRKSLFSFFNKPENGCLTAFGGATLILMLLGLFGLGIRGYFISRDTAVPDPIPSNINYSIRICDEAYKFRQSNENATDHFDVDLHDKCFSGFVDVPRDWGQWQCQLVGDDPHDWVSLWWTGFAQPWQPMDSALLNSNTSLGKIRPPGHQFRFEGKGTLRCFKITP
jgi:hypothetical protein